MAASHSHYDTSRAINYNIVQIVRNESTGIVAALAFELQGVINLLSILAFNGCLFMIKRIEWITGTSMEFLRSGPFVLVSLLVIIYAYSWVTAGFFLI
ncbi:MAG: hypothetical protein AAGB04_19835 [Pseudomonadota bacterium]